MDHEVFVPVRAERLREALADPARIARAIPGLQQDAGGAPVSGRLKVRVGSHSITYRGALGVTAKDDGSYAVEGDGTESRGSGSVKLALTVRLLPADGGTTLAFGGGATADGRVEELPPDAVLSAATRLLNRFAENLASAAGTREAEAGSDADAADTDAAGAGSPVGPGADLDAVPEPAAPSVFETEVPPSSLDPLTEDALSGPGAEDEPDEEGLDLDDEDDEVLGELVDGGFDEGGLDAGDLVSGGLGAVDEPPAEAAHARRTMIGRSAEEVDHAPPRGRYAPVPAPEAAGTSATLRWAAPAAAFVLASAIVVNRVLRKRR
ncbi:SRPBCC domain-containing protein [Streptomyces sp. NPDC059786]|uniref:SRPBCC domain-containing protein n=1 Tax=Streptomyces sp. NPDC059786 TaxID=3346946 RepID=UPI00364B1F45